MSRLRSSASNPEYIAYLLSAEWKALRVRIFTERDYRCACCGNQYGASGLRLHHKTYVRLFDEMDTDLEVLCEDCHDGFHGRFGKVAKRAAEAAVKRTAMLVALYRAPTGPPETQAEQWKRERRAAVGG